MNTARTPMDGPLNSSQRLHVLDGLRGLAILGVLGCHFVRVSPSETGALSRLIGTTAGFGWLGVDLFFVLSGFLITGILVDTKGSPAYFQNFYARRTLRIFPLYYAYLIGIAAVLAVGYSRIGPSARLDGLLRDLLWAVPYLTNVQTAIANLKVGVPLNHFWSLAVEEHFYLLWPAVVFMAGRRQLGIICGVLIALACVTRGICLSTGAVQAAQVLMPSRVDSLAMGALVAVACRDEGFLSKLAGLPRWLPIIFSAPLVMCIMIKHGVSAVVFPSIAALAFAGLLLFALLTPPGSWSRRLLESHTLRFFGKYSYGLYVFNQVIAFFPGNESFHERLEESLGSPLAATMVHAFAGMAATVFVAWLSWHLLEKHFLKLKVRFT